MALVRTVLHGASSKSDRLLQILTRQAFCYTLSAVTEEQMRVWPFVLLLVLASRVTALEAKASSAKPLHDLFAAGWDYEMQQRPDEASELGDRRWNDRWRN